MSLLFSNINGYLFACIPKLILIQNLRFFIDQITECFKSLLWIVLMILNPFPHYLQSHVELFCVWSFIIEETWLRKSVWMALLKWLIGSIEHFSRNSSIKISNWSLKIAILDVKIKVFLQISSCVIIYFKELWSLSC